MNRIENRPYRTRSKRLYPDFDATQNISEFITGLSFLPPILSNPTKRDSAVDRYRINKIQYDENHNGFCRAILETISAKRNIIRSIVHPFSLPEYPHNNYILSPTLLKVLPHRHLKTIGKTIGKFSLFIHISKEKLPSDFQWEYGKEFRPFNVFHPKNSIWYLITSPFPFTSDSLTPENRRAIVFLDFLSAFEESGLPDDMIKDTLFQWINTQPQEKIDTHIRIIAPNEKSHTT